MSNNTIEEEHAAMVQFLAKPGSDILQSLTPNKCNLMHAAIGIASEGGEILDCVKKYIIYNKDLDRENLIEELGDMEFFMQQCRQAINVRRAEVLRKNYDKLMNKRYPNGYSDQAAQERADKAPIANVTDSYGSPCDQIKIETIAWAPLTRNNISNGAKIRSTVKKEKEFTVLSSVDSAGYFGGSDGFSHVVTLCIYDSYEIQVQPIS